MNHAHLIHVAVALAIVGAFTAGAFLARTEAIAVCDPTREVFFVRQNRVPGAQVQAVTLFKVQPDGDKGDVELATIEGYYADKYYHDRKGRILLFASDGSRQSLYVYSICAGKLQKAVDLPEADRAVTSARYVGDGDTLLVATTDAGPAELATNSRLEVYEQGRRISIADVSKESPLYASVAIIGVSPDGSVAYLSERGGDAGDWWGTYYRWDKTANSVQKLGDFEVIQEKERSGYLLDALNPSATLALRVHRAIYEPDDLESPQSATLACIKKRAFDSGRYDSIGDEVLVRDMSTQEERVVYRNLMGARNLCWNYLRVITAPRWRNDHTIVFSMPYGIYEIDVRGANTRGVAFQDVALWNEGMRSSVRLVGANDEYLLTGKSSVVHIKTGREVSVPALRRDPGLRNFAVTTQFVIPTWTGGGVD
jgi:hypothetical protein